MRYIFALPALPPTHGLGGGGGNSHTATRIERLPPTAEDLRSPPHFAHDAERIGPVQSAWVDCAEMSASS